MKAMEQIVALTKKRGQLRRATTELVHLATSWLDEHPLKDDKEKQLELIKVLDQVTEGKIFVEVERARLIQRLAKMKEEEGNVEEAANLMQDVQVETFGSMDRIEKSKFILSQMRLFLLKKDYIRVQIASRKINPKFLEADDFQEIKQDYYKFMIAYWLREENYFEVAVCYEKIYSTPVVIESKSVWQPVLESWIVYLMLSQNTETQTQGLEKLLADVPRRKLDAVDIFAGLAKQFLNKKLITWPLDTGLHDALAGHEIFTQKLTTGNNNLMTVLRKRINQHNLRISSMYYEKVKIDRLCGLMKLNQSEVESEVAELVVNKNIYARIDRPAGIITFGKLQKSEHKLNDWAGSIEKVLDLVQDTCHLIQKERMIQEARAKLKKK